MNDEEKKLILKVKRRIISRIEHELRSSGEFGVNIKLIGGAYHVDITLGGPLTARVIADQFERDRAKMVRDRINAIVLDETLKHPELFDAQERVRAARERAQALDRGQVQKMSDNDLAEALRQLRRK